MVEQFKSIQAWLSDKLKSEEKGVTIVEYAIMLVLVAVVVIIANPAIQTALSTLAAVGRIDPSWSVTEY